MNSPALSILALIVVFFFPLAARADDIKTTKGVEYKNATISRAEPDGLVVMHAAGISKIPFVELPKELQEKYRYDETAAREFARKTSEAQNAIYQNISQTNARVAATRRELSDAAQTDRKIREAAKLLPSIRIFASIEPFIFSEDHTGAHIQPFLQVQYGSHSDGLNTVADYSWIKDGNYFYGVIAEPMPQDVEHGDRAVVALYKIGHTGDSSRDPLFTTMRDKAIKFLLGMR